MAAADRARQWLAFTAKLLVLSAFLIGIQTNTLRYGYGVVPVPYLVVLAPAAGLVGYLWVDDLEETLLLLLGIGVVTGVGTVAVLSAPVFLQALSVPEQNLLVGNALGESLLFTALSVVLVAAGMGVAAIARNEAGVRLPRRGSIALGIVFLVVGAALAGTLALNFTSAVEQRDVEASVESVEGADGEVIVRLGAENRLTRPLHVESVTLRLGARTPVSVTDFPDGSIQPGETRTLTVRTTCEELSEEGLTAFDGVLVRGQVQSNAFNDYDVRMSVAETTVDVPC